MTATPDELRKLAEEVADRIGVQAFSDMRTHVERAAILAIELHTARRADAMEQKPVAHAYVIDNECEQIDWGTDDLLEGDPALVLLYAAPPVSTDRDDVLEEAARWHDGEIERLERQIEENNVYMARSGRTVSEANESCRDGQTMHRLSAAEIRSLKGAK